MGDIKYSEPTYSVFYVFKEYMKHHVDYVDDNIRYGNMKARIRMMVLYHIAHLHDGIVLSTDNYTEYLLGFWTLHGDVGDFGMIQSLFKTEVYELSAYLANNLTKEESDVLNECINAVPTDGLGITDSDLDQLGAKSYFEIDNLLILWLNGNTELKDNTVIKRMLNTRFKRENPYNICRDEIV